MSEGSWGDLEKEFECYSALVKVALELEEITEREVAAEFIQAIAAGRNAIDGIKALSKYAEEVKDTQKRGEFMRIIGESSLELAETQIKLAEKIREVDSLKETISNLEKEIEKLKNLDKKLVARDGFYYTQEGDGPFCTGCYDSKGKEIRVSKDESPMKALGNYVCPVCKTHYK